ncbi:DUF349 domain-containing protein [Aurantibacillus circumpalustris]|uniref:DUF349 domain-containing protein n=1 Tax=Aurantibacillus circumpalustris TaxID=3036359 RepID=UPI00295B4905|nr:DUF349 domain-containing protein [Aurantibacillus circumpalustris]
MKTELITKMEELLLKDAGEVAADVRTLQKEYQKLWTSEFETAKQSFVDEGGKTKEFEYHKGSEDLKFESLVEKYNKLKKEADAKIASEQSKNLLVRQEIIAKIRDLSQVSENVGSAVRKLQELQTQWKETGPISSHKYKEIQSDYSRAVEDIYYNIKIFRDLQEHDLKKNFEHKTELIEKLKTVQALENVKEAERLIKIYRNEWDEIGPVPNSKWEALKNDYKVVLDETYRKIKGHYNSMEEQKAANLTSKLEIIEKVKELIESVTEAKATRWNEATEKIIALQADWKSVGRTTEKDNEKIWAEFRTLCDTFFEKKKVFFSGLNEKFASNRKIKSELIAKAEALKNSTDWQKTGLDLIRLQDTWKKYPSNGDKEEPKLFARFRKACNTFFDAKKAHYEDVDAAFEQNLVKKEEILTRLNELTLTEDGAANRELLKNISHEWNEAGMVPMKDKKRVNDAFYNRLDELYEQMHIDKNEKAAIQFKTKLDRLASSENGFDLLLKESDHLKKLAEEINSRVRTYDNNLGFFKSSKGSNNNFMKEIEDKITGEKAKIAELTAKRKLITEELNRIRAAAEKQKAEA